MLAGGRWARRGKHGGKVCREGMNETAANRERGFR
jgi:hypothetical protein